MPDRLSSSLVPWLVVGVRVMEPLEHRPIGTNGYVSTWGAITSVCPPKGC
jgi:hypothetical protein